MTQLGEKLKEARLAKNLSLDELQHTTKIQKRYLVCIEEGKFEALPGDFYVRAFIKQYAEAVGLDAESTLEEYKEELPSTHEVEQVSRVQTRETSTQASSSRIMEYMPKILITLLVIAVGVGIWLIAQALTHKSPNQVKTGNTISSAQVDKPKDSALDKKQEQPAPQQPAQPAQPAPPAQEIKVADTNGKTSTLEIRNNTALQIEVSAKGDAYVDIKNGAGKMFFNKTMAQGEVQQQDLSAEDTVRLNIGSAPNTDIKINGQLLTYPQDPNSMDHQIIIIKNLRNQQPTQ
ncbi:helix-turn-helix domain-containing protein [Ectobacillus polymachus]|uniref:helix-turn-helix domain-containing protein n=1 Tax=Ectobacillus polymachus TaxID=1508806 RepID=UPI003A883B39